MSEEHFIYDNDDDRLQYADEASAPTSRFPVRTQLVLLALLLLFIFGGLVVPKTLAILKSEKADTILPANSISTDTVDRNKIVLQNVKITAKAAYVLDATTGEVLYEKNAEMVLPLASITKLMTTLVAYELVPEDKLITVSSAAAGQQSGGTLVAGEVFKARDLADFALISSYNSAAYTLADGVGSLLGEDDGVTQFVAAMNIKASELGLDSLSYKNPTGLDTSLSVAGALGTAKDTSLLLAYILKNHPSILTPTLEEHSGLRSKAGIYHEAHNTNEILKDIPNLLGSKTGYTDLAGGNLTIAYDAGYNRPIIITVLGSTRNERFSDVQTLLDSVNESIGNIE